MTVLLLALAIAVYASPLQARHFIESWPEGDYIVAVAVTEAEYEMEGHLQAAGITVSGPGGVRYSNYSDFINGTAMAFVVMPLTDGYYDISSTGDVWCSIGGVMWAGAGASRTDRYGTSHLCLRKVHETCTTNPITGWISCTYVNINGCDWPNCAPGTSALIVGAENERYQFTKRWRETPAGLDCYGRLQVVGPSCTSCSQDY